MLIFSLYLGQFICNWANTFILYKNSFQKHLFLPKNYIGSFYEVYEWYKFVKQIPDFLIRL